MEGFKHYRTVINIDDTHLYGKYKETLLIATVIDKNNQIFLIAFAIVEKENTDTWSSFLTCIRAYVTDRRGLCLIQIDILV